MSGGNPGLTNSFNVSSITDNGIGDFTVNFSTALPSANYAVAGTVKRASTDSNNGAIIGVDRSAMQTTSACRVTAVAFNSANIDPSAWSAAFFGS